MPVLIITPLITADTCEGAAGWASGSQTCIGMKPAFVPKPITASRNSTPLGAGAAESRSKSSDPAFWPNSRNIANEKAVPRCMATR